MRLSSFHDIYFITFYSDSKRMGDVATMQWGTSYNAPAKKKC